MSMSNVPTETCEASCNGSDTADWAVVKQKMLDEPTFVQLADLFKALGDPTRVRLIYALMQNELCVHDLSRVLDMGQSAVSHQLRVLRNMRLVKRRKEGKTVYYSLDDAHIEQIIVQTLQHIQHS